MEINHPTIEFERFADDMVVHCTTKEEAEQLLEHIRARMAEVKLSLHPDKTKVVYCKNGKRNQAHEHISFDFLGYSFRPRKSRNGKGELFLGFDLGISNKAKKQIRAELRRLEIHRRTRTDIEELADTLNPKLAGWHNYYGKFRPYLLKVLWEEVDARLVKWACRRYKRFKRNRKKSLLWLKDVHRKNGNLFVHWKLSSGP
jgi:hypothetical protein